MRMSRLPSTDGRTWSEAAGIATSPLNPVSTSASISSEVSASGISIRAGMYGTCGLETLAEPLLPGEDNALAHLEDGVAPSEAFRSLGEGLNHGRRKECSTIRRDSNVLARVFRLKRLSVAGIKVQCPGRTFTLLFALHGTMVAEALNGRLLEYGECAAQRPRLAAKAPRPRAARPPAAAAIRPRCVLAQSSTL